jgi:hypothetical protein
MRGRKKERKLRLMSPTNKLNNNGSHYKGIIRSPKRRINIDLFYWHIYLLDFIDIKISLNELNKHCKIIFSFCFSSCFLCLLWPIIFRPILLILLS